MPNYSAFGHVIIQKVNHFHLYSQLYRYNDAMKIPENFLNIHYNPRQVPESTLSIFENGANCQLFTYSLLEYFNYSIHPFGLVTYGRVKKKH